MSLRGQALKKRPADFELALEKVEERFRQVVECAPYAMVMTASDATIEMVNAAAEQLFGYDRSELLGQSFEMLTPERVRDERREQRLAFYANPEPRPIGSRPGEFGLRKDGTEFPMELGLNPIETEDGVKVLSAIVDISERRRQEEHISNALKEKELLLGEVHHRVKNNLQVIQSLLYLQSSKTKDDSVIRILTESQNRIKSMALIYQTLYTSKDFSRVDFGMFLDSLAPSLVSSYSVDPGRVSLAVRTAACSLPIDAAIPCGLIVNELISNALKYGFPEGRRGQIEVELAHAPDNQVVLSVSDNGVGLADDVSLENFKTLGLQLVTLLADQLRAEMDVTRANPTRFRFQFPVAP